MVGKRGVAGVASRGKFLEKIFVLQYCHLKYSLKFKSVRRRGIGGPRGRGGVKFSL